MSLKIEENIELAPLTTFKIGGQARYFVEVRSEEDIRDALSFVREHSLKYIILAGGSNVLVPDEGINGLVIHVSGNTFQFSGNVLTADAGCSLFSLIQIAGEQGLGGWEKLAGIPGTIGGAVRGNAGAFGPEIKDFIECVYALDTENNEITEFSAPSCAFAYRMSHFKQRPELIITKVRLALRLVESSESKKLAAETVAEREKRHIQNVQAAGSFFMNPVVPRDTQEMFETEKNTTSREGRVPAGWLIEKAGLKGARVGGAVASVQHPNYIKNDGNATAQDVKNLAQQIKLEVLNQFGVELKEEAVIL